jgi:single-strand DNA-binding protein
VASFNTCTLIGNLTRDVEMKYTPSGLAISNISLAVSEKFKKGDQWKEETSYIDVTLFGRTAEIANEYLSKGNPVLINGRLKQETWEKDGQKRSKVVVIADKLVLLGSKGGEPKSRNNPEPDDYSQPEPQHQGGGGDDIPF